MIPIIDWHCDVLYKLEKHPEWRFSDCEHLDVNALKMRQGGVKVQAFALFIEPSIPIEDKFASAKCQVERFKTHVLSTPGFVQIRHFKEIHDLKDDEIGVFLTLEGLDCVGSDLDKVKYFLDEGVLSVGFTWNNANLACDGIMEPRGAGLSAFGYDVVSLLNERGVFADVSHISEHGFEDVLNSADHVIASHSNARSVFHHVRNLTDHQLSRMLTKGAPVHLVFFSRFTSDHSPCTLDDLIKHLEYMIQMGLVSQLGLGSDFDGIDDKIVGLEDSSQTQNLLSHLEKHFGQDIAQRIAYKNFMHYVDTKL